jgi:hypothetical protein
MLGWDGMWREEERRIDEETNRYRDAVLARLLLVTVRTTVAWESSVEVALRKALRC